MYNYITIIICIIFVIVARITIKNLVNPLLIFGALWAVILWLDSLYLFELHVADDKIYRMILIGTIAFGMGYLIMYIWQKRYKLSISFENNNFYKEYLPKYELLCVIGCICIVYYLKNFIAIINLLLQGSGLDTIRAMAQNQDSVLNTRSNIENALRILIILPCSMALEPITAVDFWLGKRHKALLVICMVIISLRVLTEGGRTPLVNFILYIIVAYILSNRKQKRKNIRDSKKKTRKWYITTIVILGVAILYYTTISREGINTLKTTYYYFAMEPYMFDIWAKTAEDFKLVGYGLGSLNGFIFPILYLFKNLLGIPFSEYWSKIYDLILQTDSQWQIIAGSWTKANAYVSVFWYFYLDGRIWGIIIGMFLYGMIVTKTFISAIKHTNAKSICIYALILQGLFFSFIRCSFANVYYTLALLFIIVVAYKPMAK